MATRIDNFKSETQLTTSAVALVSAGNSDVRFIGKASVTNTSTSNIEVIFWRIATASTPTTGSGANWIVRRTIAAGRTEDISELMNHVLGNAMSIFGSAATASVVNFDCSGLIET
jgi:hypothetical protein